MGQESQRNTAAALLAAYGAARYRASVQGHEAELRLGAPAPLLDALQPRITRWAVITACNPGSCALSDDANLARDAGLAACLFTLGVCRWPALNSATDGGWLEPSWLVGDLPLPDLDRLAREFGQRAVLAWERGAPVRVRCYLAPGLIPVMDAPFVDWVACAPRPAP